MTTIVYNHTDKEIGIDSRCTIGNLIESDDMIKMRENKGIKFFLCGSSSDIDDVVNNFPCDLNNDFYVTGFIIKENVVYYLYCENKKIKITKQNNSLAVGSGSEFAISAIDFGKNTRQSIEYAISKDNCSGGKVRIYKTN